MSRHFWEYRDEADQLKQNNGSMFFVNAGNGIYAVTAKHVYDAFLKLHENGSLTDFGIVPDTYGRPGQEIVQVPLQERLIDQDSDYDLVTFSITDSEMTTIGSYVISTWPPKLPELGYGIGLAGYPGQERIIQRPKEVSFAPFPVLGIPASINERQITVQFDEEFVVDTPGFITAPPSYATGGMSGGPLMTHVNQGGVSIWRLGGVIVEGRDDWGLITASRVDRLNADGTFQRPLIPDLGITL